MAIEEVMLKNGDMVPVPMVATCHIALSNLMDENPIAFYELVMKCRDRNHRLFGNSAQYLSDRALLEPNGQPHDLVRSFVLSAVTGEGFDMVLGSPLTEQEGQEVEQ